ncbi:hypothetical protein ACFW5W_07205 [Streptomyces sp. NPDC058783]|uniref:hypothetical protein n=1 Tax=Streptomyces sp. NPDC058783 TaxID=3346633 RepID=UPI0036A19F87
MTVRAAWLLPGGTAAGQTREDTRLAPVGTMTPAGELTTRPGVVPGGDPFAATGAGAMSLQIGVGRATVQGTTAQGAYPVAVTSPETLTFTDGAAQFARIDTVALHIYDGLYDTSGETLATLEVVEGEATATPSPPALPVGYLRLWDVTVPAGASAGVGGIDWGSALADRRQYTAAVGGIVPRGSLADPGAYDGQYADVDGTLLRWSESAGAWQDLTREYYVSVLKTGTYDLAGSSYVNVVWSQADAMSTSGMWSSGSPTRLVAPVAGLYAVYAHQTWPGGTTAGRVRLQVNGTGDYQMSYMSSSGGGQGYAAARMFVLAAGDYVEMALYSSTALTDVPASYSKFGMHWVGP